MLSDTYIDIRLPAFGVTEEGLSDFLFSEGATGLVTEDRPRDRAAILIRASFPPELPVALFLERLGRYQQALADLGFPVADGQVEVHRLPIEDWGQNWKRHFTPLPVGQRLIIAPPWERGPFPQDRLLLRIEPAMAFGTGHHVTTRMCLETLEERLASWAGEHGPSVLDVGTGTGILAIAAAALGARRIVALDTDPEACAAVKHNVGLNGMEGRIQASCGRIGDLEPGLRFDLILANLDTKTLCPLFGALRERLAPGGGVIVSGVLVEDKARVRTAAGAAGHRLAAHRAEDGWLCLTLAAS
jgi:ribosomal protein L11 methyltransferase